MTDCDHDCNAWCEPPDHVRVVYTPDNPPEYLQPGRLLSLNNATIEVIRYDPAAPEGPFDSRRPEGYDHVWLLQYRYLEEQQ